MLVACSLPFSLLAMRFEQESGPDSEFIVLYGDILVPFAASVLFLRICFALLLELYLLCNKSRKLFKLEKNNAVFLDHIIVSE